MCGGGGKKALKAVGTVFPVAAIGSRLATNVAGITKGLGSTPDAPPVPDPPPAVPEAEKAPEMAESPVSPATTDAASPKAVTAARRGRRRRAAAAGGKGTILTSPRGVTSEAPVAVKTLLGQ